MTITATAGRLKLSAVSGKALQAAAGLWFLLAVTGQWVFLYYIVAFFGGAVLAGNIEAWNAVLPHGIIPGDTLGNLAVAMHLMLAAVITVGGPLQLIPKIRTALPAIHRWTGRVYVLTAFAISIDGIYMIVTRGAVGGWVQQASISLNGILIMLFATMTLRHAIARNIKTHRRWALRLFMVVSGVWFFRVGLMFWILVNQGPVGFDPETFTGPAIDVLGVAQYLVPLAVLELYLYARERAGPSGQFAAATGLLVLTAAMGVGIFGAVLGMWLPKL